MAAPTVLTILAMGIWAKRISLGPHLDVAVPVAALTVFVVFALWGAVGKGRNEANPFGPPLVA